MAVRHTRQSLAELNDRQLLEYFADFRFSDPIPNAEVIREGLDRLVAQGLIEPYREAGVATTLLRAKAAARALLTAGGPGYPVAPSRDIGTDQGAIRPDIPSFRAPRPR